MNILVEIRIIRETTKKWQNLVNLVLYNIKGKEVNDDFKCFRA